MRTLAVGLVLLAAVVARGERVTLLKDFANDGFLFQYGSWENNVTLGPEYVSVNPPATDCGGAGSEMPARIVKPGAKIRLTARLGQGNQAERINVVLLDQDGVQGTEGYVYFIPATLLSTQKFVAVELKVDQPDLVNNVVDGRLNLTTFDGGLVGWHVQGSHGAGAVLSLQVKKLELIEP